MADYLLREYSNQDIPSLKRLWAACFGDREEYIDGFFSLLPGLGTAISAVHEGRVCGSAYILEDMKLCAADEAQPVALIYAVAVDESCRRLGIGAELVRRAVELARQRGAKHIVTLPAEESLYGWYEKVCGFKCRLYRQEKSVETMDMGVVKRISAEEYSALREERLRGRTHIVYGPAAMRLQELLCRTYSGGLFSCAGAIAAAYRAEGVGIMQELICPEGMDEEVFAAAIGFELDAEDVKLQGPANAQSGTAYLAALDSGLPEDCYWPLAFD